MGNYTESFTQVNGDVADASALETEFDAIATAVNSKLDSDGTGTMTGDLNMGNNDITNVADPTSAQYAATKNYVDTMIVLGTAVVGGGNTPISTVETNESEITVAIPSAWNGYFCIVTGSGNIQEDTASGAAVLRVRVRQGSGTAGDIVETVAVQANQNDPNRVQQVTLVGHDTGLTTTGNVTYTMTSEADAENNDFDLNNMNWSVMAVRTS